MQERSTRSDEFRYVPADRFTISVNENSVRIAFGMDEKPNRPIEHVGVFMPVKSAAILHLMIEQAITQLERIGVNVDIDESKRKQIEDGFHEAIRQATKTSDEVPPS